MLAAVVVVVHAAASEPDLRQPVPGVHAISGVSVVTEPGEIIDNATLVVRDGLVEAVGESVSVPDDAELIEFDPEEEQITIYPGLIDAYVPVKFARDEDNRDDEEDADADSETLRPGRYPHPLVTPERRLTSRHWPQDRVEELRNAGFTTAVLAPESGLIRGVSALVNLGEGGYAANVIDPELFVHMALDARISGRDFPNSMMGAVALMRQTFLDARWQAEARAVWQEHPDQPRPEFLEGLEPLEAVLAGDVSVVFETEDMLGSLRAASVAAEFGLRPWLVGHGYEYQRLDSLAETGLGQILPLDFPEPPDVEENERDVSLAELRHWDRAPDNPARVMASGLDVLLTSHPHSSPDGLFENLEAAVERGLDADRALAALTTEPATMLGIGDRAGRLQPGYMANFVLVEGELFTASPGLREVWVDGRRHLLRELEPPEVEPAGTWELTLEVEGMGDMDAGLELKGEAPSLTGHFEIMGTTVSLSEARVSGKRLDIRIDGSKLGMPGAITLYMDIEEDRGRGSGSSPQGEFGVRGRRTGDPDDEEESA